MRIFIDNINLDYNDTKAFFEDRAEKYSEINPYSVTMYQDDNPELVNERNVQEVAHILPYLCIAKKRNNKELFILSIIFD